MAGDHVVIESDTPELETIVERELPPTFTQRSPGHYSKHFFYNGGTRIIPLFDKSKPKGKDNVGHVKSGPSYVVGPGSVHPNGGRYEIVDNRPVASITEEQIHLVLAHFIARRALAAEKAEAKKQHAAESFPILDLVHGLGLKERSGQLQGSHPVHGSQTGANFSVNPAENVWHCFRCHSGGGPWHLLAVMERVIDCRDAVAGGLRGELFKKARDIALEKGLVKRVPAVFSVNGEKPQLTEDARPHEVAEAILQTLHIHSIFNGETYVYQNGVYREGGEAVVRKVVEANFHKAGLDQVSNNHFLSEVLGHVQRRTYTRPDIFDPDPKIANLTNGLLDLDTCELKPHTPDYPSLARLPVRYDPAADYPRWKQFLSEVLHPDDLQAVQEFIGSLLWKGYETQKAWLQAGEGANGKDTLDRVLEALLGPENVASRSLQDLENNRFAKAELHGKLANIYSDLSDTALKTTGAFKTLTGEGSLAAEKKFQHGFKFNNHAKLIFSCNKIPASPDDSDAFFRRWFITTFPNTFLEGKADPRLVAKLTTPEELSGILNWALEGLRRLRQQNWRLSQSKSVEETRNDYIRKSDPVKAFVMDCCLADPEGTVGKQPLFQAFVKYCELKRLPPVTSDTFYKRLPMAGVPISSIKLNLHGQRIPAFKGLFLRRENDWGKEVDEEEEEKAPTGKDTLDPHFRREKGGLPGLPGPNQAPGSTQSTQSRAPPPKAEVGTEPAAYPVPEATWGRESQQSHSPFVAVENCSLCGETQPVRQVPDGQHLVCQRCYETRIPNPGGSR